MADKLEQENKDSEIQQTEKGFLSHFGGLKGLMLTAGSLIGTIISFINWLETGTDSAKIALGIFIAFLIMFIFFVLVSYVVYMNDRKQNLIPISIIPQNDNGVLETISLKSLEPTPIKVEEPLPNLSFRLVEINASLTNNNLNLILERYNIDEDKKVKVYAVEVRFAPTLNIGGSVSLEASLQINNQFYKKAHWLNSEESEITLSVGNYDNLIVAVGKSDGIYFYEIDWRYDGMETLPYGHFSSLADNTDFLVEIICKQKGKVILIKELKLRLSKDGHFSEITDNYEN